MLPPAARGAFEKLPLRLATPQNFLLFENILEDRPEEVPQNNACIQANESFFQMD
jgi:hypothetical protein